MTKEFSSSPEGPAGTSQCGLKERQACEEPWTEFPFADIEFEMSAGHLRGDMGSEG